MRRRFGLLAMMASIYGAPMSVGSDMNLKDTSSKRKTGHRAFRTRSQQKKRINARQAGHAKRRGCRL